MTLDDLAAMAGAAPAMQRMRGFVAWVGPGRPLTQTGRIRAADAVALVELLGPGDVLDPRFPIHSSTELLWLSLWVGWAKACRPRPLPHTPSRRSLASWSDTAAACRCSARATSRGTRPRRATGFRTPTSSRS